MIISIAAARESCNCVLQHTCTALGPLEIRFGIFKIIIEQMFGLCFTCEWSDEKKVLPRIYCSIELKIHFRSMGAK